MEISLIRHGKTQVTENSPITCGDFRKWVEKVDDAGVVEAPVYPVGTLKKMQDARIVVTSNLKRSIESAKLLGPDLKIIANPLFREIEFPALSKPLRGLKLKPYSWIVISTLLWLGGYANGCESFREARKRAKKAARMLVEYAREYDRVILVGHGFFNFLIATELRKTGWRGKRITSFRHWGCTTYVCLKDSCNQI
ncbi:MAG: phosphoglycerate mutase family protein [Thermoactinomyces sp.]